MPQAQGNPDVVGMVNDPQFLGMSPADQRTALNRLTGDNDFNQLSDVDTLQFVSRLKRPPVGPPVPQPIPPELRNAQMSPQDEQSNTRQMLASGLTGMPTPNMTALDRTNFETGKAVGAASVPVVAAGTTGATLVPEALGAGARALIPPVIRFGQWAAENPRAAGILREIIKHSAIGGGYAGVKKILDVLSPTK